MQPYRTATKIRVPFAVGLRRLNHFPRNRLYFWCLWYWGWGSHLLSTYWIFGLNRERESNHFQDVVPSFLGNGHCSQWMESPKRRWKGVHFDRYLPFSPESCSTHQADSAKQVPQPPNFLRHMHFEGNLFICFRVISASVIKMLFYKCDFLFEVVLKYF